MKKLMMVGVIMLIAVLVVAGYLAYASLVPAHQGDTTPISSSGGATATVWQTLFITNNDGSTYWVNPPTAFNLLSIFGSATGSVSKFDEVANVQNNIYMTVSSGSETVQSWSFSCQETITLNDLSNNVVGKLCAATTVNANGNSVTGKSQWVTGASQDETSFQNTLSQVVPTPSGQEYYFVITLANINLSLTFTNGQTQTLTAPSATPQNTLQWLIEIQ